MNVSSWIPFEVFIWILATFALAQVDQAERLFNNADTFMAAGKFQEGLADYQKILDLDPSSPWAAKALLKIAQYYSEVEQDYQKALVQYGRVQKEHGQDMESAPAAYYGMSVILDRIAKNHDELESAVADLMRMNNIYRNNAFEDGGLYLLGKISKRLHEYNRSLSFFQRLEFSHPESSHAAKALLESSRVAYFIGQKKTAELILARLQRRYPQSDEAKEAERYLRLLENFRQAEMSFQLDRSFAGAMPKKYDDPYSVAVSNDELVGILDQKTVHFIHKNPLSGVVTPARSDLVGLCLDVNQNLVFVMEDRLIDLYGRVLFSGLTAAGKSVREIEAAAIDDLGRLVVLDGDQKDALVFDRTGAFLKALNINRPKSVRCFEDQIFVVPHQASEIIAVDGQLTQQTNLVVGLNQIVDFCFDSYGHVYVLCGKGYLVAIFDRDGRQRTTINLKSGGYPLKQAHAMAVDRAGTMYLVDRKGGAVYRFF